MQSVKQRGEAPSGLIHMPALRAMKHHVPEGERLQRIPVLGVSQAHLKAATPPATGGPPAGCDPGASFPPGRDPRSAAGVVSCTPGGGFPPSSGVRPATQKSRATGQLQGRGWGLGTFPQCIPRAAAPEKNPSPFKAGRARGTGGPADRLAAFRALVLGARHAGSDALTEFYLALLGQAAPAMPAA